MLGCILRRPPTPTQAQEDEDDALRLRRQPHTQAMSQRTKSEQADGFTPPKPSPFSIIAALLFLSALGWMGWAFGTDGLSYVQIAQEAPRFTPIQGKITSASTRRESQNFLPDIHFEYSVDGKTYKGNNRHSAEAFRDATLASRELQRYKIDHPVQLYYNPKNPTQATLSREIPMTPGLIRLLYSTLSLGAMVFSVVVFIRVGKRTRAIARSKYLLEQERIKRHERAAAATA